MLPTANNRLPEDRRQWVVKDANEQNESCRKTVSNMILLKLYVTHSHFTRYHSTSPYPEQTPPYRGRIRKSMIKFHFPFLINNVVVHTATPYFIGGLCFSAELWALPDRSDHLVNFMMRLFRNYSTALMEDDDRVRICRVMGTLPHVLVWTTTWAIIAMNYRIMSCTGKKS